MIKFGTEGWRAVIADEFTFSNVEKVSQAVASYLKEEFPEGSKVVVGYDRRFLSEQFALRAAKVLASNGFKVLYSKTAGPTPMFSFATVDNKAVGAIVITASHNPYYYNGFKFKPHYGGTALDSISQKIASKIGEEAKIEPSAKVEETDFVPRYVERLRSLVNLDILKKYKAKLVFDPMHGAAAGIIHKLLEGTSVEVEEIRSNRDPLFGGGNPEPIHRFLQPLKEAVEKGADLGLATDGDGDRIGGITRNGIWMWPQVIFPIIVEHFVKNRQRRGKIVKTISASIYIDLIAKKYDLELDVVPVGFKFITEKMLAGGVLIGGEESGGIGIENHIPERDGLLSTLLLLEALAWEGLSMDEALEKLYREYGYYYYDRIDIECEIEKETLYKAIKEKYKEFVDLEIEYIDTLDGVKLVFKDNQGWLLFRRSGTEPVLRIYCEATSKEKTEEILQRANEWVRSF